MNGVRHIYPEVYQCSKRHRRIADAVMAAAGLAKGDVTHMKLAKGKWHVHYLLRGEDGRPFGVNGKIATGTVTVSA